MFSRLPSISSYLGENTNMLDYEILQGSGSGSTFGEVPGLDKVFYMLMASDVIALILLTRLVIKDIQKYLERRRRRRLHVALPHEIAA